MVLKKNLVTILLLKVIYPVFPKKKWFSLWFPSWLVVSTHLKNMSQNGNLPQIGVNMKIFETTPHSFWIFLANQLSESETREEKKWPVFKVEIFNKWGWKSKDCFEVCNGSIKKLLEDHHKFSQWMGRNFRKCTRLMSGCWISAPNRPRHKGHQVPSPHGLPLVSELPFFLQLSQCQSIHDPSDRSNLGLAPPQWSLKERSHQPYLWTNMPCRYHKCPP